MTDTPNERSYLPPEELPFTTSYLAIASLFLGVLSWVLIPFFLRTPRRCAGAHGEN
jgi:hypothetical protein